MNRPRGPKPQSHIYFVICGPSGAGKSRLVNRLSELTGLRVCHEPPPPPSVTGSSVSPPSAYRFQRYLIKTKLLCASASSNFQAVVLDRSLEEDREVFLPFYHALGFLDSQQIQVLRKLSHTAERQLGEPNGGLILFADQETLRERVEQDPENTRPQWLLNNLTLEYDYYDAWIAKAKARYALLDTSGLDQHAVLHAAQELIAETMPT